MNILEKPNGITDKKDKKYFIGKKIHHLTLLNYITEKNAWQCQCDCGNICNVQTGNFNRRKGKSCIECKPKYISELASTRMSKDLALKKMVYRRYKANACDKNKLFQIEEEYFFDLMQKNCFYCHSEPNIHNIKSHGKSFTLFYNGVDRVDNSIGYTKDNCVPCCNLCNISKNNHSLNDWKNWINRISQNKDNF